jgi:hypothetical protein
MTHEDDSPWKIALEQNNGGRGTVIPNFLIQNYFKEQAKKNANA